MNFIAVGVVAGLVVGNLVAYSLNENSWPARKAHLPSLLFCSNRSRQLGIKQRPKTLLAFDILNPRDLVTSTFAPTWVVLLSRLIILGYFAVAIAILAAERKQSDSIVSWARYFLIYFTNWTFILFGLTGLLGTYLTARHLFDEGEPCGQDPVVVEPLIAQHQHESPLLGSCDLEVEIGGPRFQKVSENAPEKWTMMQRVFCLLYVTTTVSTLFLSVFYWLFLQVGMEMEGANVWEHGVNLLPLLLDVFVTRVPFCSYHYQVMLLYGSVYAAFMWTFHAVTGYWVYGRVLDWNYESSLVIYMILPVALFIAFLIWYGIAKLREVVGTLCCCCCRVEPDNGLPPAEPVQIVKARWAPGNRSSTLPATMV